VQAGGLAMRRACARSGTARGVAARPGRELQQPASGVIRLAAFCDLRYELWLHVANSASDLLDLLQQFRVRNEPADLRKRRLEPGKCWPVDLVIHLLPAVIWRDHEQVAPAACSPDPTSSRGRSRLLWCAPPRRRQ